MFWNKKQNNSVFYASGKELQPQYLGEMAIGVACQAYPNFIEKLESYSDTTNTQGKSLYQILIHERRQYLSFHFHSFIASIFFAFAKDIAKVPEPIYLRIAAGMVSKRPEILSILERQLTDEELQAFSGQTARYSSLVFSEKTGAYNPASTLCANCLFDTTTEHISEDENFSLVELAILPKLLDAEIQECLEAINKIGLRYEER